VKPTQIFTSWAWGNWFVSAGKHHERLQMVYLKLLQRAPVHIRRAGVDLASVL